MNDTEQHIGDGVYAALDNGMIRLRTQREHGWETVYLEPEVWHSLKQFVARFEHATTVGTT